MVTKTEQEFRKAVQQEEAAFQFMCNKVIQAYKIKLLNFRKRHELLLSIEHNFGNIPNNPRFYFILENCLKREKKLLDIIKGEDAQIGNRLDYIIKEFKKAKFTYYGAPSGVRSMYAWNSFIEDMDKFVKRAIGDISLMEGRMKIEEKFIERKDSKSFNNFIKAWEKEMKAHDRLAKHLNKVIRKNKTLIIQVAKSRGRGAGADIGTPEGTKGLGYILAGVISGGGGAAAAAIAGFPIAAVVGGVVGAAIALAGFIMVLTSVMSAEAAGGEPSGTYHAYLPKTSIDEKIIKDIKKKRGVKKGWFF